ncbi:MAG: alcohol dehydrogenase zinc-binding domain containing protein [Microvirga sp.]|jgi:hypothetical protein|nr:alcohol dehydrogenase zinc-binding domain containing protein [Microvirga sp.]
MTPDQESCPPALGDGQGLRSRRAGPRATACGERGPGHLAHHGRPAVPHPGSRLRAPEAEVPQPGAKSGRNIEAVGNEVTGFEPGDTVFGIWDGSFAEYVGVRTDKLASKPSNLPSMRRLPCRSRG